MRLWGLFPPLRPDNWTHSSPLPSQSSSFDFKAPKCVTRLLPLFPPPFSQDNPECARVSVPCRRSISLVFCFAPPVVRRNTTIALAFFFSSYDNLFYTDLLMPPLFPASLSWVYVLFLAFAWVIFWFFLVEEIAHFPRLSEKWEGDRPGLLKRNTLHPRLNRPSFFQ